VGRVRKPFDLALHQNEKDAKAKPNKPDLRWNSRLWKWGPFLCIKEKPYTIKNVISEMSWLGTWTLSFLPLCVLCGQLIIPYWLSFIFPELLLYCDCPETVSTNCFCRKLDIISDTEKRFLNSSCPLYDLLSYCML
jgi:hypothetical protein